MVCRMVELLSTKLFIPRPRSNLVSRTRLTERLNASLDKKLTLIAAPAGFGKTTLLSEWIPQSPRCVTWFSLDEGDNDPTQFWSYFIASLQKLRPDLGEGALALLQSLQATPITSILTSLINDLTTFPDTFSIVLDDYHVIGQQSIHEALTYLLAHWPVNMHLVITTRSDPPLPLARLRARNKLAEIRANDLRFAADEVADFLTRAVGLRLLPREVAALEARTEGWIAGLQIAALSMQGREDMSGFIQSFSGSHRHILGYLVDEVINQRPKGTLDFLLTTSILDRLCGSLCDAVTGNSDGQAILENLERVNLFITPLDEEGKWYRYHQLFADVLQARLKQNNPDLVAKLHRRAGNWYAQEGMFDDAMRHALAGADFEEAARLIERVAGKMLRRGSSASLIQWLKALPDETFRAHPRLCLARGWTFVWGAEFSVERADEWAQIALKAASTGLLPESELEGELYALKALIAADRVDLALSQEHSHHALKYLPADSPWLGVTMFTLGSSLYAGGEFTAADPVLNEALRLSQADGTLYIQLIAASFLADILVYQSHLSRAMELYQQVLAWGDLDVPQKGALLAHAGLANILCEQNELDAALAHVQSGISQLEQVGGPGAALWLYRILARVQLAKGNLMEALDGLDRVYQQGQDARIAFVMTQAAALRAQVLLAQGDIEAGIAWTANSGLNPEDPDASHPGLQEVEYIMLARVLNAEGRWQEALSLLQRLEQSAQVDERAGSVLTILVIQALVNQSAGNLAEALECLKSALSMAEPEGYVRIFVDEGDPMRALLADFQLTIRQSGNLNTDRDELRLLTYSERLMSAFYAPAPTRKPELNTLLEPLSERELEILQLIELGLSNKEIAKKLVIAVSTVKSHINSLYGKLGTQRRTQAIAIARELGILSNQTIPPN